MRTKPKAIIFIFLIMVLIIAIYAQNSTETQSNLKVKVKTETGQLNGAYFRIQVPLNWNKGLVMYCHGYQLRGKQQGKWDDTMINATAEIFLSKGFAVAQSEYSTQGWAVKEAIEDTEVLRRYFASKYGKPTETYITGHSMGAVITIATIERYPEIYNGAMPMCGPLNPSIEGIKDRAFDMLVTFDYFFPNITGSVSELMEKDLNPKMASAIRAALTSEPEKAKMFANHYQIGSVDDLANTVIFYCQLLKELYDRTGGNPFDNRNTIYNGFENDLLVNRGVKRYQADPKAQEYMRQYYTPSGHISDPVLGIHTIYDPLVTAKNVLSYDATTKTAGTSDLFMVKFTATQGHCAFRTAQMATAFDELLLWVHQNKRPTPGEIK